MITVSLYCVRLAPPGERASFSATTDPLNMCTLMYKAKLMKWLAVDLLRPFAANIHALPNTMHKIANAMLKRLSTVARVA